MYVCIIHTYIHTHSHTQAAHRDNKIILHLSITNWALYSYLLTNNIPSNVSLSIIKLGNFKITIDKEALENNRAPFECKLQRTRLL